MCSNEFSMNTVTASSDTYHLVTLKISWTQDISLHIYFWWDRRMSDEGFGRQVMLREGGWIMEGFAYWGLIHVIWRDGCERLLEFSWLILYGGVSTNTPLTGPWKGPSQIKFSSVPTLAQCWHTGKCYLGYYRYIMWTYPANLHGPY